MLGMFKTAKPQDASDLTQSRKKNAWDSIAIFCSYK